MSQPLSVEQAKLNLRNSIALVALGEGKPGEILICIDALILSVRAEQQETLAGLTENLQRVRVERDAAIDGDLVDALKARAESAEQQLAAALKELADDLALRNGYLVQANEVGRATVLAQVKALISPLRKAIEAAYTGSAEHGAFFRNGGGEYVPSPFMVLDQLDALQPDPDLAVLSTSEREQALKEYAKAHIVKSCGMREEAEAHRAEARRLLKLPAQPTTEER